MVSAIKSDQLVAILEYGLAMPPVRAGDRLKSERELADFFKVGRAQVRGVVDRLVLKGVLVRRPGSGTFIRKVAVAPPVHMLGKLPRFSPEDLIARRDDSVMVHVPTTAQQRLFLSFWGDWNDGSDIHKLKMSGIVARIEELGHHLVSAHSLTLNGQPLSKDVLAKRIRSVSCDGYIVVARWGRLFLDALGTNQTPIVFFGWGGDAFELQPSVAWDFSHTCAQAIHNFRKAGLERIALMGLKNHDYAMSIHLKAYEQALREAEISYRAVELCGQDTAESVFGFRRLLSRTDRPQAIYVTEDSLLTGISAACAADGIIPGRDIAIITLSNRGISLPQTYKWSFFECNQRALSKLCVGILVQMIQTAGDAKDAVSLGAYPLWCPGDTHMVKAK